MVQPHKREVIMKKNIEDFIKLKTRKSRGTKIDQVTIQTGKPKNTYKRGDEHPFVEGLVYRQWYKEKEIWITKDSLEKERNAQLKRNQKPSNKELKRKLDRDYYERNKDAIQKNVSKWKADNQEKIRLYGRTARSKRKALLLKADELNTDRDKKVTLHIYDYAQRLSNKLGIIFEVDHIIPLSNGGLHHPCNLQVVPRVWNRRKHNRNTDRWLPNGF
jgi:hypothetical protein